METLEAPQAETTRAQTRLHRLTEIRDHHLSFREANTTGDHSGEIAATKTTIDHGLKPSIEEDKQDLA